MRTLVPGFAVGLQERLPLIKDSGTLSAVQRDQHYGKRSYCLPSHLAFYLAHLCLPRLPNTIVSFTLVFRPFQDKPRAQA